MIERRLGSTEIAAVMGYYIPALAAELPRNKNITDVWQRLFWGIQHKGNARTRRGNKVEPKALEYYRKHIGPTWRPVPDGEFWTVQHPSQHWFTASPDAYDAPKPRIVIEAKSQSEWARKQWGEPGTDKIATRYLYQATWLLSCCDAEECHVLCMFGHDVEQENGEMDFVFTEPAIYRVERDAKVEDALLTYGKIFIDEFVATGIPPPVKPATCRRELKERMTNEWGRDAVFEWEARCAEHAATQPGAQVGRGDAVGGPHP